MKRYTREEKIKIGQETFYRLIETEYGENVKEEMMEKYNIGAFQISTFLNMFKKHIVEPKPTVEEIMILDKYYQKRLMKKYQSSPNGLKKEYPLIKLLLSNLNEEELNNVIERYNLSYIKRTVNEYIASHPNDKEELTNILSKLDKINETKKEERKNEREKEFTNVREENVVKVIEEFLNSNDIYPNYIFGKYSVDKDTFNDWLKLSSLKGNEDLKELLSRYNKELKLREAIFVNGLRNLNNSIVLGDLSLLNFYRSTHMPLNKFKFFMYLARRRGLIDNETFVTLDTYIKRIEFGSYQYNSLEELKEGLNYNYNGVQLSPNIIDQLCVELNEEDIPINRNTIISLFQEEINKKLNKK